MKNCAKHKWRNASSHLAYSVKELAISNANLPSDTPNGFRSGGKRREAEWA